VAFELERETSRETGWRAASSRVQRVADRARRIYNSILGKSEAELIAGLPNVDGNPELAVPTQATPEGYGYVPMETGKAAPQGEVLFLAPHATDASSDFFALLIQELNKLNISNRQLILTRGEKGDSDQIYDADERGTIARRLDEERRAAEIIGINVDYLTLKEGPHDFVHDDEYYLPDSRLIRRLPDLKAGIKQHFITHHPSFVCLPSLEDSPDHIDHLATAIAFIEVALELRDEGYFEQYGPIEIYTSDPEFAVANGQTWSVNQMPVELGGTVTPEQRAEMGWHGEILERFFPYRYRLEKETGLVKPVEDITRTDDPEAFKFRSPLAVPPLIVSVDKGVMVSKLQALLQHDTQVGKETGRDYLGEENAKDYAEKIPYIDFIRALQLAGNRLKPGHKWATALYPVTIPGVTREEPTLVQALPSGTVFQLKLLNEEAHSRAVTYTGR
jgi:LmbE family N-acetylglucosaminyl deacetylase